MQHTSVYEQFNILIKNIRPLKILEIGTSQGGLTLMLRDILNDNGLTDSVLRTYDIHEPKYLIDHIKNGSKIDLRVESIFNYAYNELSNADEVIDFIRSKGTTLVLCDGGSKKNEFRLLSNYLKNGDVIMAHDYAPNEKYFQEHIVNKIWNWLEIQDSDIQDSCIKNNLVPFMDEEFRNVVWVCKIKE